MTIDDEYAYLDNPQMETLMRLGAVHDLRCGMHERAGEARGVLRVTAAMSGLRRHLLLGDAAAGLAFLDGIMLAADLTVNRLRAEVLALGGQVEHVAGTEQT